MAEFKSDMTRLRASAERVYDRLSDFDSLREMLTHIPEDKVPADKRAMFEAVEITSDTLTIPLGQAGPVKELKLRKDNCKRPTLVRLVGVGTPVPLALEIRISPDGPDAAEACVVIDVNIPMLLRPMVAPPLQKAVNQFAEVLGAIPFGQAAQQD